MQNIRTLFRRSFKFLWISLAILVILFAVVVSISRMLIPLLSDYKTDLEQIASQQLGRSIKVGSIDAEWIGFWPDIHLSEVKIQSSETSETWLQIKDAWLSLDLLSFFQNGYIDTQRVEIEGLQLNIKRKDDVLYTINGEAFRLDQSSPEGQAELVKWLFSRDRLHLSNCDFSFHDERNNSRQFEMKEVTLNLENNNKLHHAYGRFKVPGQQESSLSFVLDMNGDMHTPQEVLNKLFLQGNVVVTKNMQEWLEPYINLHKGAINLRLWAAGQLHKINRVKAELSAKDLSWSVVNVENTHRFSSVDTLKGSFFVTRRKDGWIFDVEDFSLSKNGIEWPQSEAHLVYQAKTADKPALLEGTASYIKLQDISGLLSENLPPSLTVSKEITQLALQGSMSDMKFRLNHTEKELKDFYINAKFRDLGFDRRGKLPGVSGLDGRIVLSEKEGALYLKSNDATLDFGNLFSAPLEISQFNGDVYWKKSLNSVALSFDNLVASNDDVETLSRANILIPFDQLSPFIDMNVEFKNAKAVSVKKYIPRTLLGEKTLTWLDKAFINGSVPDGKMIFHGNTRDFPFTEGQGSFLVDFNVEQMQFEYAKAWPHLHQVNANIVFSDESLQVDIHDAEVMQVNLKPSTIRIEHLGKNSVVEMDIDMRGKTQGLLDYLHKIPLDNKAQVALEAVAVEGGMSSHIEMSLPLETPDRFSLQGNTQLENASLQLKKWKHEFKQVSGALDYSFKDNKFSIRSNNLKAEYLGKPTLITVKTENKKQQDTITYIDFQSRFGLSALLKEYLPPEQTIFSGESDWMVKLGISAKGATLYLESELSGEILALPDHFFKQGGLKRTLKINADMAEGKVRHIKMRYGDMVNAIFRLPDTYTKLTIKSGAINFGKNLAKLPEEKGLVISGKLGQVTLNKWMDLIPPDGDNISLIDPAIINKANLDIGKIIAGQQEYNQLSLIALRRTSDLFITLGAKELAGEIIIPFDIKEAIPLDVRLQYLYLKTASSQLETSVLDPRKLPAINLESQKLFLNGNNLGTLSMKALKDQGGLKFELLEILGKELKITAQGSWLFKKSWHESSFNVNFSAPRIGDAMKLFNFQTSIENGEASAQLQASWSGPPHWFEMKRLNGNMTLSIKDGQLQDIDPGGGRIFGLLSVQNLPRRLSLDFSDLFKKGFGFDKIEGQFNIADGDAFTNNLYLDGPAARLDITGRIGLANEDYDEEVFVTPKLSSSLPVLGLAAGPQVALGLYLTEKILRKNINKMSRTHYSVTGSWDNPVIKKISVK